MKPVLLGIKLAIFVKCVFYNWLYGWSLTCSWNNLVVSVFVFSFRSQLVPLQTIILLLNLFLLFIGSTNFYYGFVSQRDLRFLFFVLYLYKDSMYSFIQLFVWTPLILPRRETGFSSNATLYLIIKIITYTFWKSQNTGWPWLRFIIISVAL